MLFRPTAFVLFFLISACTFADEVLLDQQAFLKSAFADSATTAEMQTLWVDNELKQTVIDRIDYRLHSLRLRYWQADRRTAWILEEIGKERPITMGVVVENNKLVDIKILVYRESRGGEVRHDFFTRQFDGAMLVSDANSFKLDQSIDGITGATLSVRAVKKVATLALFLHQHVTQGTNVSQEEH